MNGKGRRGGKYISPRTIDFALFRESFFSLERFKKVFIYKKFFMRIVNMMVRV